MELKFLVDFLKINKHYNYDDCNLNISIDSRSIKKNDIFVGIRGKNFNGSLYAQEAVRKGAVLAIVDQKDQSDGEKIFYVKNSIKFLGDLACAWRNKINPVVFGVTGSSGKTTVKEIISIILSNSYGTGKILTTIGNFNNNIGLPLTLLALTKQHKYAVIEMGMNHFGEIEYLSKIAKPDYALINNIQRSHIGCGFESLQAIAKAKLEILVGLQGNKTVVLPKEDQQYEFLSNFATRFRQISFGVHEGDIRAFDINLNSLYSFFKVNYFYEKIKIFLPLPGEHNIRNVLAAIAMIKDYKIDKDIIINSIKDFNPVSGRLNVLKLKNNITLINDTYNSNPDSMKLAIDVLSKFDTAKILVMGDMGELGNNALDYHLEIGRYAKAMAVDLALFVGNYSQKAFQAFGDKGIYFKDKDSLIKYLIENVKEYSTILIKGSRFMKMEYIFLSLQEKLTMD